MKKACLAALLLLGPAACRRAPRLLSPQDALYETRDGSLRCEVPKDWRVLEDQGGAQRATFFGPPDGPRPYAFSIGAYFYGPGSPFATPQDWARAQALSAKDSTPLTSYSWKGRSAFEMTVERRVPVLHRTGPAVLRRDRAVVIPASGGFWALVYSAPQDEFAGQQAVFDRFLQSLELPGAR